MSTQEIRVKLAFDAGNAPASAQQVAEKIRGVGDAAKAASSQQEAFIASLREQAATQGMTGEQLLRYKAQQLGVADQANVLIDQMHRQGQAGQTSAAQMAAAMRTVPAQMTDIVTQLQGGASPLTILLQQGGQMKDSFGGIKPMMAGLLSTITPVAVGLTAVAAAVGLLGYAIHAGSAESDALTKSFAVTGGQAGVTLGQVTALSRGIADSGAVTIGVARDIAQGLVETGKFSGSALDSAGAAAASLSRVTGQSADEIVKDFSGMADGATAWATKANRSYDFLSAAQLQHIRELEAAGRQNEAMQATTDALKAAMDQRLTPSVGYLGQAWKATKTASSEMLDSMKDLGREETAEGRVKSLTKQLQDLQSATPGKHVGLFDALRMAVGGSGVVEAMQAETQAQLAEAQKKADADKKAAVDKAASAREEQRKIEEGSKAHVDTVLQVERAGDAVRMAQAQASIDQRQQAAASGYRSGLSSAQDYAAQLLAIDRSKSDLQAAQIQKQIELEKRRVVENPRDVLAQRAAIAQLEAQAITARTQAVVSQRELARGIQASQDALDLAQMQTAADEAGRALDETQAIMDARQRAGLMTSEEVAQAKFSIERARLAQSAALIDEQIAQEQRRQQAGTAALDSEAKLIALRSQRSGVQAKIDLSVTAEGGADAERELAKSRDSAQKWADTWLQVNARVIELRAQNAKERAGLIVDPIERAREETSSAINEIQRKAADSTRDLQVKLPVTVDPEQQALLKQGMADLAREEADQIVIENAKLDERIKPEWRKLVEGWRDHTKLMEQAGADVGASLVKSGEDLFSEFFKTGKMDAQKAGQEIASIMGRTLFRDMTGQMSKAGWFDLFRKGGASASAAQGVQGGQVTPGDVLPQVSGVAAAGIPAMGAPAGGVPGRSSGGDAASSAGRAVEQLGTSATSSATELAKQSQSAMESGVAQQTLTSVTQATQAAEVSDSGAKASAESMAVISIKALGDAAAEAAIKMKFSGGAGGAGGALPSAVGHVFTGYQRFATGASFTNSVVSSPTLFQFMAGGSRKLGELGEAGPEAVMPLDQTGAGLGVGVVNEHGTATGAALKLARGRGGRLSVMLDSATAAAALGMGGHARYALGDVFSAGSSGSASSRVMSALAPAGVASTSGAAASSFSYTGGPIHIDARSDQAQIAQMVMQAQQQERKALLADLKARGVIR